MAHECADQHTGGLILIPSEGSVTAQPAAAGLMAASNVSSQPVYIKVVLMHENPQTNEVAGACGSKYNG